MLPTFSGSDTEIDAAVGYMENIVLDNEGGQLSRIILYIL